MLGILVQIPLLWERFVSLLSRPVIWMTELLEGCGESISAAVSKKVMRVILSVFLAVEILVFAIYAFRVRNLGEIVKTAFGCSMYGGFIDLYDTITLQNTGVHLWITSGILWILSKVLGKLVEKNEQPGFMQTLHAFVFALFYSAVIGPVYSGISNIVNGSFGRITTADQAMTVVLNVLPLILLIPLITFAVVSGMWITVSVCYDAASVILAFFVLWAFVPDLSSHEAAVGIGLIIFMAFYIIVKQIIVSKKECDEYKSVSILHALFEADDIENSILLTILFFILSFFSAVIFIELLIAFFFPDFAATIFY